MIQWNVQSSIVVDVTMCLFCCFDFFREAPRMRFLITINYKNIRIKLKHTNEIQADLMEC